MGKQAFSNCVSQASSSHIVQFHCVSPLFLAQSFIWLLSAFKQGLGLWQEMEHRGFKLITWICLPLETTSAYDRSTRKYTRDSACCLHSNTVQQRAKRPACISRCWLNKERKYWACCSVSFSATLECIHLEESFITHWAPLVQCFSLHKLDFEPRQFKF